MLFGTTAEGGPMNLGTIFEIGPDGSNYHVLYNFGGGTADGHGPRALTLIGNLLYGITDGGGANDQGTLYQINEDGSGFRILHSFGNGPNDGVAPLGDLTVVGATIYGTTNAGGGSGLGTVYAYSVPEPSTEAIARIAIGLAVLFGLRSHRKQFARKAITSLPARSQAL
jgi:uncharacterized repeat protein (TIGR03803 family)